MKAWLLVCTALLFCLTSGHFAGPPKSKLRTEQLLFNIRSHLAKVVDEAVQQKECDSGLTLCTPPKEKQASLEGEEDSEEIPPAPKIRGRHKPDMKINPKDVIQTMIHKVHINRVDKDPQKAKKIIIESSEDSQDNDDDEDDDSNEGSQGDDDDEEEDGEKTERVRKEKSKPKEETKKEQPKQKEEKRQQKQTEGKGRPKPIDRKEQLKPTEKKGQVKPTDEKELPKPTAGKARPSETVKTVSEDEGEGSVFPEDIPVFAPSGSVVKSGLCRRHSRMYRRQLARYRLWALMMFDATAKLPSGVLQGNANQFGDFDECLAVNAVVKGKTVRSDLKGGVQGRYCLAAIDVEASDDEGALEHAVDRALAYGFIRSQADDPGYFIPRFTTVNWGVCVPSSCSADDVQQALQEDLLEYNSTAGVTLSVHVDDNACVDRDSLDSSFSVGTLITLVIYGSALGLAAFATYQDLKNSKTNDDSLDKEIGNSDEAQEKTNSKEAEEEEKPVKERGLEDGAPPHKQGKLARLVLAFSIPRTWAELLKPAAENEIQCIHGVKAVFTVLLYIAHKTVPLALTPYSNRIAFTKVTNAGGSSILRASMMYTDGFLLASGVLSGWQGASRSTGWLKRLLTRFLRLTPPLLAVLLAYSFLAEHLGSGPQWGPIVGQNAEMCRQHAWKNLLYIQNFFDFEEMCAPQTHQLALDMQLSYTAPLLVGLIVRYDLLGLLTLQSVFVLSSILRYIVTINNDLSIVFYHGVTVEQLYRTANLLYSQVIYRATPYVLGVTLGYYLQQSGQRLQSCLQRPVVAICWIGAVFVTLLTLVPPSQLADRRYEYSAQEAAQYAALAPIAWAAALGWIIAACHLGFGGHVNKVLSSRALVVVSRLSYAIYLVQFLVFNHNVGSIRTSQTFSLLQAVDVWEVASVLALSTALTLVFDIPFKEVKAALMEPVSQSPEGAEQASPEDEAEDHELPTEKEQEVEVEEERGIARDLWMKGDGDEEWDDEDEREDAEEDIEYPEEEHEDGGDHVDNFWGHDED